MDDVSPVVRAALFVFLVCSRESCLLDLIDVHFVTAHGLPCDLSHTGSSGCTCSFYHAAMRLTWGVFVLAAPCVLEALVYFPLVFPLGAQWRWFVSDMTGLPA